MKSNILVGRVIEKIRIASDKKAILFVTDKGDVIAKADGDCCSSTWFENISLPAYSLPLKVIGVEDIEMPESENENCDGDVIAHYGCKVSTEKGDIVIDYRNESNGYYGGNISWPDENGEYDYFYGGVYGQNISTNEWADVQ